MTEGTGRFAAQVAVVTGAARGIGAAIAGRLAAEGATVVLVDRDPAGEETAEALRATGRAAEFAAADVTDADAVDAVVAAAVDRHGRLDVLVNNAGITRDNLIFKLDEDDWDTVIDVNLKSAFLCSRAAQRAMVEARRGAIVNLSSRSALGNRGQANYSAAKAGIRGLTSTLALELGPFGIRANAVAPGYIATEMTDATARRLGLDPEEHRAKAAAATPLRRVGTPADVASVVAFLASDDAAYVSGQTIEINGGAR
ncbi:MAG: 3-oxoacyl-ACP reductase FabG [Actinobacteria bacterium]|nr:3-oxoacyl-ACP reductase FabG [Actinomycetota bacterium]